MAFPLAEPSTLMHMQIGGTVSSVAAFRSLGFGLHRPFRHVVTLLDEITEQFLIADGAVEPRRQTFMWAACGMKMCAADIGGALCALLESCTDASIGQQVASSARGHETGEAKSTAACGALVASSVVVGRALQVVGLLCRVLEGRESSRLSVRRGLQSSTARDGLMPFASHILSQFRRGRLERAIGVLCSQKWVWGSLSAPPVASPGEWHRASAFVRCSVGLSFLSLGSECMLGSSCGNALIHWADISSSWTWTNFHREIVNGATILIQASRNARHGVIGNGDAPDQAWLAPRCRPAPPDGPDIATLSGGGTAADAAEFVITTATKIAEFSSPEFPRAMASVAGDALEAAFLHGVQNATMLAAVRGALVASPLVVVGSRRVQDALRMKYDSNLSHADRAAACIAASLSIHRIATLAQTSSPKQWCIGRALTYLDPPSLHNAILGVVGVEEWEGVDGEVGKSVVGAEGVAVFEKAAFVGAAEMAVDGGLVPPPVHGSCMGHPLYRSFVSKAVEAGCGGAVVEERGEERRGSDWKRWEARVALHRMVQGVQGVEEGEVVERLEGCEDGRMSMDDDRSGQRLDRLGWCGHLAESAQAMLGAIHVARMDMVSANQGDEKAGEGIKVDADSWWMACKSAGVIDSKRTDISRAHLWTSVLRSLALTSSSLQKALLHTNLSSLAPFQKKSRIPLFIRPDNTLIYSLQSPPQSFQSSPLLLHRLIALPHKLLQSDLLTLHFRNFAVLPTYGFQPPYAIPPKQFIAALETYNAHFKATADPLQPLLSNPSTFILTRSPFLHQFSILPSIPQILALTSNPSNAREFASNLYKQVLTSSKPQNPDLKKDALATQSTQIKATIALYLLAASQTSGQDTALARSNLAEFALRANLPKHAKNFAQLALQILPDHEKSIRRKQRAIELEQHLNPKEQ